MSKRLPFFLSCVVLLLLLTTPVFGQVDTVEQLTYPPLPEIQIPQPTRVVLDNGMVVFLLEDHELPTVQVSARIRTGSRLEPAGKVGLASLTGTVLRSGGTTTRTGDQLNDYLESKAASIETGIGVTAGLGLDDVFERRLFRSVSGLRRRAAKPAIRPGKTGHR